MHRLHNIKFALAMVGKIFLTTTILAIIVISVLPFSAVMQSIPCTVIGHVTADGSMVSGALVSLNDGQSGTTDGNGYFQFTVSNGSSYTISASYNGHSASKAFTAIGAQVQVDININTAPTPTTNPSSNNPTTTATPTPIPSVRPDRGIISFGSSSKNVEDEGNVSITVVRTGGSNGTVTVDYSTANGSAVAGTNYLSTSGTLTFANGETSKTFIVTVLKGDAGSKNLTFTTILQNPTGGASLGKPDTFTTTISHGPINGVFSIEAVSYNTSDIGTLISVKVSRLEGSRGNVTVEYYTMDESAVAGINYVPVQGVLAFADGETSKVLNLTILENNITGDSATFRIALKNATGGAFISSNSSAMITINRGTDISSALVSFINGAGRTVASGNPGQGGISYLNSQQVAEKALRPVAAIAIGVMISIVGIFWAHIAEFLLKLLGPLREIVMGYTEELFFHIDARTRKVKAVTRTPLILGISLGEIITIFLSTALLGLAFSYAEMHTLNIMVFLFVGLVAGVTLIIIQIASRLYAHSYKMVSEYKFWDIGALTLILTTLFVSIPFARPAMVVLEEEGGKEEHEESLKDEHAEHGEEAEKEHLKGEKEAHKKNPVMNAIIAISSPYTGLVLSIAFMLFILYGGILGEIGISGIKISALLSAYTLLPLKPMEGRNIFRWNKLVWAMMFIPSILLYILVAVILE